MPAIAKIFMTGRSQAVRLPKEFRLPGKSVRVRRVGKGILLEPLETDVRAWPEDLQAFSAGLEWPDREQPPLQPSRVTFDD